MGVEQLHPAQDYWTVNPNTLKQTLQDAKETSEINQEHRSISIKEATVLAYTISAVAVFAFMTAARNSPPSPELKPSIIYSRDSRWVGFAGLREGTREVAIVDSRSFNSSFTPYCDQIVFVNNNEIFSANLAGTETRQLTYTDSLDLDPVLSPDCSTVAFSSSNLNERGNREIFTIDINGENLRQLTDSHGSDLGPSWSPDGTMIAFQSYRGESRGPNIYVMSINGEEEFVFPVAEGDISRKSGPQWTGEDELSYLSCGETAPCETKTVVVSPPQEG